MKTLLPFHATMVEDIEQETLSWDDWGPIQVFHDRHISSMVFNRSQQGRPGNHGAGDGAAAEKVHGQSKKEWRNFCFSSGVCFNFNVSVCPEDGTHDSPTGKKIQHVCCRCLKEGRGLQATHHLNNCRKDVWQDKKKSFPGGRPTQQGSGAATDP